MGGPHLITGSARLVNTRNTRKVTQSVGRFTTCAMRTTKFGPPPPRYPAPRCPAGRASASGGPGRVTAVPRLVCRPRCFVSRPHGPRSVLVAITCLLLRKWTCLDMHGMPLRHELV